MSHKSTNQHSGSDEIHSKGQSSKGMSKSSSEEVELPEDKEIVEQDDE